MMLNTILRTVIVFVIALSLGACGSNSYDDLDGFMAEKKSRPAGVIKPIPAFKAYKAYAYAAAALRSPFDRPLEVSEITRLQMASDVEPDLNRNKEHLEQYNIDSLLMVGTLQKGETFWALVVDPDSMINRVRNGDFIGRNHGQIVETNESYILITEIVPNGLDGWIERPRTIELKTSEE